MRPRSPVPALCLGEAFSSGFDSPAAERTGIQLVAVELSPDTDPLDLWVALPSEFGTFWETTDETIAGIGICLGIDPAEDWTEELDRVAAAVHLSTADFPTDHVLEPRLLGSVPFAPGWVDERWASLSNPGFVLPRWTVFRTAAGVTLQLAVEGPIDASVRKTIERDLASIESALSAESGAVQPWTQPFPAIIPPGQDARSWQASVASAVTAIREGHLQKVVLSRFVTHDFPDPVSPVALIRRLSESGAGRYRFGLRQDETAFIGASPECLFDKRSDSVRVEVLAGTVDLGPDSSVKALIRATEHLFTSVKDLEEHLLVVRGVLDALEPVSESVASAEWPLVREARGLAHLSTDVTAELCPGVTPLALIDALHPTPAVGGLPSSAALEFIQHVEPEPRGLFAAPVGWISPSGDACLAVAIRSALLCGDQARVYAGAGIVSASDPTAEWEETEAKLRWLGELGSEDEDA
ncbi:MAG: chorismate-binding protein [Gemmatimonadales bacterium]